MIISIIVAHDKNYGIGKDNALPWAGKLPRDMRRFKDLTMGHPIIMGRKTFDSIGRALPGRMNIVLTRDKNWNAQNAWHVPSLEAALREATRNGSGSEEVFIIGGAQLFTEALPMANRMFITEIGQTFDCDVFFPPYDQLAWKHSSTIFHHADEKNMYKLKFLGLERKTAP